MDEPPVSTWRMKCDAEPTLKSAGSSAAIDAENTLLRFPGLLASAHKGRDRDKEFERYLAT